MGILDYQPDPIGQGLLGFGTALMTPRALGGGMAAGLNAFNTGALQANQLKRQQQQDAIREQLLQAQMQSYQSAAEDRKAQAEMRRAEMAQKQQQAEAQRGVLSQFAGPPMGFRDASIAMGGTAPAGYTPPAKGGQITREMAAQWVAAGGDLATLKQLAESGNFGREEVARVLERRGADGTPEQVRESRFGDAIGAAVPKPFEMRMTDIGGSVVPVNPYAPSALSKTMTPGEIASNAVARGNLSVAQGNLGLSRQRLEMDRQQAAGGGGFEYRQTPEGLIVVPKVPTAEGPVQSRPVLNAAGAPVGGTGGTSAQQKTAEATEALQLIKEAEAIVGSATGSFVGAGLDMAARAVGMSTAGAQGAAQLKALEGALVAKMPKMSGPQSDKDVQLYRQQAGEIGDPTVPAATKLAALKSIEAIQRRYAGLPPADPKPAPAPAAPKADLGAPVSGQSFADMPPAQQYRGKSITDTVTGKTYKSNGFSWVPQ